jgi:uncharacterized protein YutE (UPF0331/DUF86 family)
LVREELITARLERLRDYLRTLKTIQKYDIERFKNDVFVRATTERYLHLSIECLLDIGNHIISDEGFRKPDTYAEIFEILVENKVISKKIFQELEGMTAFRNVLVHDYLRIDADKVHTILCEKLLYIEKLGNVFGRYLGP